jgi:hypothetical protein
MKIDHLIDGKAVAGRDRFETVNPATQEVLAEVASGGEAEVHAAVAAAKAAFPKWAGLPATERAKKLRALGDLITRHVPEIARTETDDTGQVIAQTGKGLVPRAADNFHYFAEMCVRVDGHTYPTPTHLNYTLFHPVGVCALVSPWNVPFMTATWKVAPCLAFGNTAVLKMSELSPLTAARLGELALEAGIPAGVLNVVHGFGKEAGEPLVAHPDVRAISFTGSTATGNRIVKTAGLKKFSMELGGKSPFVIFDDADLDGRYAYESGIAGITVTLTGTTSLGAGVFMTIFTDYSGRFVFTGALTGTYALWAGQADGFVDGLEQAGSFGGVTGTIGSDLISGIAFTPTRPDGSPNGGAGYTFGEIRATSIHGDVFVDANENGYYDATFFYCDQYPQYYTCDPALPGVTVVLTGIAADTGASVWLTTTSVALPPEYGSFFRARYTFSSLRPGT